MGNRSSIQFKRGEQRSPVLCKHWGGEEFHRQALDWLNKRLERIQEQVNEDRPCVHVSTPSTRMDIGTVFCELVVAIGSGGYIGRDRDEVDDYDCGCLVIDLDSGSCEVVPKTLPDCGECGKNLEACACPL